MDVRGPTRAAAKRLISGTVMACAAAAVCAPVAGASTVTLDPAAPAGTPVTYLDESTGGNTVTLTSTAAGVSFADPTLPVVDATAIDPPPPDQCQPDIVAPSTFTCPVAPINVTLGLGDDTLKLGDGLPMLKIDGRTGADTVDFGPSSGAKTVDLAAGTGDDMTLTGIENVNGGPGGDTVTGDAGPNTENGAGGNDALNGGDGTDVLDGGPGVNSLNGGDGDDTLTAGNSGDLLDGGAGADTLTGGDGNDTIVAADALVDGPIDCGAGTNDTVVADLGPAGPVDTFVNCENIQGTVRSDPTAIVGGTTTTGTTTTGTTTETIQPVIVVPALGTPPLTQVLAPGNASIADLTPPGASMRTFSRQRIPTVVGRGVRVRVTCKETCGISIALSVDRATAKRLRLDSRTSPVVVGTATATRLVPGSTVLRVKLTKQAKAALKASKRNVRANTQVLVSDASGNGTLLSRRVTFVR